MTVETPTRHSPLAAWQDTLAQLPTGMRARELPFLTQLTLRLRPGSPAARSVEALLGITLPGPLRAEMSGDVKALWTGPDEWLLVASEGRQDRLVAQLRTAVGDEFATVTDVSAQRTTLALSEHLARTVLAQGCAVDLDPRVIARRLLPDNSAGTGPDHPRGAGRSRLRHVAARPHLVRVLPGHLARRRLYGVPGKHRMSITSPSAAPSVPASSLP